ncbi:MAG: type II toxin-antitoxin system HicB family antitoxin [Acidobacteria bacterium]|nr:type II toxin-antitoxin system HicB family antitoxin [Acidobacteriota bacterium]
MNRTLTAIIEREEDLFVALCPEYDIVSQGASVSEARKNLQEALELFFEAAPSEEQERRYRSEVYVTNLYVAVG